MRERPNKSYYLDLIRTDVLLEGLRLPHKFSDGTALRYCSADEVKQIDAKYELGQRSAIKQHSTTDKVVCLDAGAKGNAGGGYNVPLALVLLHKEVQIHSTPKFKSDAAGVVLSGSIVRAPVVEASGAWPQHLSIDRTISISSDFAGQVDTLLKFELSQDQWVLRFLEIWRLTPKSHFRFVALVSLIEGLIGNESVRNKNENIASKLEYFYGYIIPTLQLSVLHSHPAFGGKTVTNIRQLWSDLYKIRNHFAHGGAMPRGETFTNAMSKEFGVLGDASYAEVVELGMHAAKSLIYWQLEDPKAREAFRLIV